MKRLLFLLFTAFLMIGATPQPTEQPEETDGAHQHVTIRKSGNDLKDEDLKSVVMTQEGESSKQSVTLHYEKNENRIQTIALWSIAPVCWMLGGAACFYFGCRYKTLKGRGRRKN